jgi:hypothetical protein
LENTLSAFRIEESKIPASRLLLAPVIVTRMLAVPGPVPKSKTRLYLLVIVELIVNHAHIDMSFGIVSEGSWKNCELVPVKNALFELAPNGPDAWEVGEDVEAVKAPVTPLVSLKSSPVLNV